MNYQFKSILFTLSSFCTYRSFLILLQPVILSFIRSIFRYSGSFKNDGGRNCGGGRERKEREGAGREQFLLNTVKIVRILEIASVCSFFLVAACPPETDFSSCFLVFCSSMILLNEICILGLLN
jgi:hypothetical protein